VKQKTTAFCVAAAFGCIATLGAQTQPASTGQPSTGSTAAREVTITGCLAKSADGRFTLTNARIDEPMANRTSPATTSSTTAGTPATGTPAPATTWMLGGGSDLEKHLGHQLQVTGKTTWDGSMDHGRTPGATGAAGTSATTGTTGTATATGEQRKESTDRDNDGKGQPRLDVQSMKMIAPSCS
jgi:hypothetical protein